MTFGRASNASRGRSIARTCFPTGAATIIATGRRSRRSSTRTKRVGSSTSALELGIDIPQFTMGLNIGVPQTRKAFRQRVGRIGRGSPVFFCCRAPLSAFRQLGSSFREFYEGEVENSHLDVTNRFIQFQQARCLVDELPAEQAFSADGIDWPDGFAEMVACAQPGATRPRDLDHLAALGSECPHISYPLRDICETSFALRSVRNPSDPMGKIELIRHYASISGRDLLPHAQSPSRARMAQQQLRAFDDPGAAERR